MKKISIMMFSTLSGSSYKGRQLEVLIPELETKNILGKVYGIRDTFLNKEELNETTVIPVIIKYIINKILKFKGIDYYYYLMGEKVFGFLAKYKLKKDKSDIIFLKARPVNLVKQAKKMGKYVIVEAGELYPRESQKRCKQELLKEGYRIDNIFTDEKAVKEFEESLSYADKIIVLSDFSKKTFIKYGIKEEKIKKINLGVDPIFEKSYRAYDENKRMGYICVASHSLIKGTHKLIKIWNDLSLDADLILIGPMYKEIEAILNKSKNKNIRITGSLNKKEIKDIFKNYNSVGVSLSIAEGYSRVIAEYLYEGLPVITTEVATCDYIIANKTGEIVSFYNEKEIKDAFKKLYKNKELYNKYSKNNFNRTMNDYKKEMIEFFVEEVEKC